MLNIRSDIGWKEQQHKNVGNLMPINHVGHYALSAGFTAVALVFPFGKPIFPLPDFHFIVFCRDGRARYESGNKGCSHASST